MSGKVVVNTTVIQYLHALGLIHILHDLFGTIYVPLEVKEEIEEGRLQGVYLPHLDEFDFIKIIKTKASSLVEIVRDLGKGETSVILLGMENPNSLVILDDRLAQKVARSLELKTTGTAGILIMAKEKGLIEYIKPYIDKLIDAGFYLAPEHRKTILNEADEA